MKEQSRIAALVNSKYYPLLLFFISFVFVTLFSRSTSFLYVYEGSDAAIFKQMGLAVLRGKTMYVDYFDNKGCLLYFIQAFGLWLGGDFFILIMQTLSMTITLIIWDKLFILYLESNKERFFCLSLSLFLLLCFYEDGDMSEEWCLPYASYPLLVFFRTINHKQIKLTEMFIMGLCFGIIAFIRINNSVPFIGFLIYYWVQLLIKKNYKMLFQLILAFFLGLFTVAAISMLYFYLKAGWVGVDEMVYATYLSNFDYFGIKVKRQGFLYVFYYLFLILCILQQFLNSHNNKEILIPILISYILFFCTFGMRRCATHYLIAILPLLVILLMTTKSVKPCKKNLPFIGMLLIAIFFYLPIPLAFATNDLILKKEKHTKIYNDFHRCIENIPITERDSIYNYNLYGPGAGMMQHERLLQCNKVFFSYFAFHYTRLYKEETKKTSHPPKWILISWDRDFMKADSTFFINNYTTVPLKWTDCSLK